MPTSCPPSATRERVAAARAAPEPVDAAEDEARRPRWVRDQRNSWHGVDFPYHTHLDIAEYYKRYSETLRAVDDSIGRVLE